MAINCTSCGFEFDESEDIYCSGCGTRVASVALATENELTFYADGSAVSAGATVRVPLTNRSDYARVVTVRSLDGHTRVRFDGDVAEYTIPAHQKVGVVVTALPTLRNGAQERIEFRCRAGRLTEVTSVRVAPAPRLLVRVEGPVLSEREHLLGAEATQVELRAASPDGEERVTGRKVQLRIAPQGSESLSLDGAISVEPQEALQWIHPVESTTVVSQIEPLIVQVDRVALSRFDGDQEVTVSLPFVSLGTRSFRLKAGVQRQPRVDATPDKLFLQDDGLLRQSGSAVSQSWTIRNPNAAPIKIERVVVSGAASSGVSVVDTAARGRTLGVGQHVEFSVKYVPQEMFAAARVGAPNAGANPFRIGLVFSIFVRWENDTGRAEEIRKEHEIDLKVAQTAALLALDFGTSNTCMAYVKGVESWVPALNAAGSDKALLLSELSKMIEFAELDAARPLGASRRELASVVRVDRHSPEHNQPNLESSVGWVAYNEMFLADYARRTAWMLKRGLPQNGFGPSLMDIDGNQRTYEWSTLVQNYLTHAFRRLVESRNVVPAEVVYSYPGTWDTDPATRRRLEIAVFGALRAVGAENVQVSAGLNEPEALAIHYANAFAASRRLPQGDTNVDLVIFDCGGGTTDVTCVRLDGRAIQTATGRDTTWSTDSERRLTRAAPRGGEDLTFEIAREIYKAFVTALSQPTASKPVTDSAAALKAAVLSAKNRTDGGPSTPELRPPAPFPSDVGRYAMGAQVDPEDRAVLDGIMVNARNWKLGEISSQEATTRFPVKARTIHGELRTVQVDVPTDVLRRVVRDFFAQLLQDVLVPTVQEYTARYSSAALCLLVPCGNSTRHPLFAKALADAADLLRAQGGGRRSVQAQLGDDERKASVVHGLLIHALREREELAGKPSPLPDILDQLPVESRAKIPARAPGVIKAAGVAHVGLIAGQTGPVCARLEAGAPFARLATSPVRALSARAELQVGPTADGPWMPVWESSRSVAGSELAQALDSATGEVRRVILSAHVEGDEFIVSWEADAAYGATLPGGVLTTFNVSDLVARSRGQA